MDINTFVDEFNKEIVGEEYTIKFLMYVMASRWVKNKKEISFHTLLNSESGAGKDFVLQTVFKLIEPSYYAGFTRISSRALDYLKPVDIYSKETTTWCNKFIGLEDIESEILNSSTLKVFLSNGSRTAIVTDKGIKTTENKGCPTVLMTSAYSDPNKELMRRINIIQLDESDEQTHEILRRQAKVRQENINYDVLQEYINSLETYDVRIDYAFKIALSISNKGTHMRTFFPRFLDFIKASCVLHQKDRVIENGRIYANEQDYNNVKALFEHLNLTVSFNPISREKKEMLNTLIYEFQGDWFNTKQACLIFNISYQAMFKNIKQYINDNLLETKSEKGEWSNKPIYYYKPIQLEKLKLPEFNELIEK